MVTIYTPDSPDNKSIKKTAEFLENLAKTTNKFNQETSRQTEKMIRMTRVITWLTVIMVIGLAIQIWLALFGQ